MKIGIIGAGEIGGTPARRLTDAEGVRRALSEASKERKPEWRAA
jgi:predicted dinucleotide-binding enzyme